LIAYNKCCWILTIIEQVIHQIKGKKRRHVYLVSDNFFFLHLQYSILALRSLSHLCRPFFHHRSSLFAIPPETDPLMWDFYTREKCDITPFHKRATNGWGYIPSQFNPSHKPRWPVPLLVTRNNLSIWLIIGSSFPLLQCQFKSLGQEVIPIKKTLESHISKLNNIIKE